MHQFQTYTSPPGGAAPLGTVMPSVKRRPRWPVAVLACLALAIGSTGVTVAVLRAGEDKYPKAWDVRVEDLASFVERERGLKFEHPVYVDFLSDAEFREMATEREEPTTAELAQIEREEAMLRAMGLVTGDVDLLTLGDEVAGEGILGFYEWTTERITVRGDTLTNETKATLVHELTHTLQDQHFDLGRIETATSGAGMALRAVAEADADDVMYEWIDTLSQSDQEDLAEDQAEAAEEADFEGVPPVFLELAGFPYAFGPGLLEAVKDEKGQIGRDQLFTDPPLSEEHVVLPRSYLNRQRVETVETPTAAAGESLIEDSESDFGMVSLLVVLAERLEYPVAWRAVQGWAGDASAAFVRDGKACVRVNVAFDQPAQAELFENAFAQWGQGFPTTHSRADRLVKVESCDPGTAAAGGRSEDHVSGLEGLGIRMVLSGEMLSRGLEEEKADCMADRILENIGINRFLELDEQLMTGTATTRAVREIETATLHAETACP